MARPVRAVVITLIALQLVLLTPNGVSATDGDLLCRNHDVFGNVFVSSGRARANVCQLNDCPTGVSSCTVQVRWLTKCEWVWCTTFDDRSGWVVINGASQVSWCQYGKQQYKLEMRLTWQAPTTRTVRTYGALEGLVEIGGGFLYRQIAHAFNVLGFSGESTYESHEQTVTATSGSSFADVVATSGNSWITLSC